VQVIRRFLPVLLGVATLLSLFAPPASAAEVIDIIEVKGRIDPVLVDFVTRALRRAEADRSEVLVIHLDSPGALVDADDLEALTFRLQHASIPVAVWVGPTGARAYGGAVELMTAAGVAGMAQGTRLGRSSQLAGTLGAEAALERGFIDTVNPTLGEFVIGLDGRHVGGVVLRTAREVPGEQPKFEAAAEVRFAKLRLIERLLHTAALPAVAYVLLMAGLLLVVFEFFSAGVGVAGAVGAGSLVLAAYGLAVLPTDPVGLGLLVLAVFGFSVDVQAGAPRTWTVIGTVCLISGSLLLYDDGLTVPWLTLVLVVAGTVLFMVSGMTSMLRARFSTATIGRESMIGEMGRAATGIAPEGTVTLKGGVWRARTNRATPIASGDPVRVVAVDGLLLEVEPEEGGARDAGH
jgi:membrane-bound serine protease (ClpP class)